MQPRFFSTPDDFRRWLPASRVGACSLWVGFFRKGSGRPSITWPESVDEALCFGRIDGVRKSLDELSYVIRFTPRRKGSFWSDVNTRRANEPHPHRADEAAGLLAFKARDPEKASRYSFEQPSTARFTAEAEARFRANTDAWRFLEAQPAGYRKTALWWVLSAKQESTRQRRLNTLIAESAAGRRIGQLRRKEE